MVAPDVLIDEAHTLERGSEAAAVESGDGQLDVDDVLRGEARDRGGADVVDAEGQGSDRVAHRCGDHPELVWPARLGLDDGDPSIHVRTLPIDDRRGRGRNVLSRRVDFVSLLDRAREGDRSARLRL